MSIDRPPWGWRVQRAWALGPARRWVWLGGILVALTALAAAVASYQRARDHGRTLEAQLTQARANMQPAAPQALTVDKDFAQSLGSPLNAVQVVQELQRACSAAGILLASVQAQERPASSDQLGRLELAVSLRGAYPGTKQALKQVLERFSNITVQRLRMRRSQAPTDVETSVTLSVWSQPAEATATAVSAAPVARER